MSSADEIVHRSASWKFREAWGESADVFQRSSSRQEDEADLRWAALERLPTYDRMRRGVLRKVGEDGKVAAREVEIQDLGLRERKELIASVLRAVDEDNERFLRRLRERIDRVGIELPKIEVRFENLSIESDAHSGKRATPSLLNATLDAIDGVFRLVKLSFSQKKVNRILRSVNGILKPSRMILLLGPPGAGKSTLLQALAGKHDNRLRQSGRITYCGHELLEFVPQRTCAYISQQDLHVGEMTVRETLEFSGCCMGVGTRYEMLSELSRREKEAAIKPDPEIDAFMKATALEGQHTKLITEYTIKMLGLDICADILVGDEMRRGISGGQKKRVTTGEMLVGPARALFMDEISNGLDSSTTYQIIKHIKQVVHVMDGTTIISLLQPSPETYELFDDIILLSEGRILYQGPRENILEFFEFMGFQCPERKGVADFLQEVTSKKDQEQYWFNMDEAYVYVSVDDFVRGFDSFYIGQRLTREFETPYNRSKAHLAALSKNKYGPSKWELLKVCFSREWLLMKRNSFIYVFKTIQITFMSVIAMTVYLRTEMPHETIADGGKFLGALFYGLCNVMFNGMAEMSLTVHRLPVFYKQRDFLFYPPWAFALPIWILKMPISLLESSIWIVLTYYVIGFAPAPGRFFRQFFAYFFINQMALGLFRFIAAVGRIPVVSHTFGNFTLLAVFVLGGFVISKDDIKEWLQWAYYFSPMMYGQNALSVNEFLDRRWSMPNDDVNIDAPTVGTALLKSRGLFTDGSWYWISIGVLAGFSVFYNLCFIVALTLLNPFGDSHTVSISDEETDRNNKSSDAACNNDGHGRVLEVNSSTGILHGEPSRNPGRRGMVLPFQPLCLTFNHINYYVGMPSEMKKQGIIDNRLQLLCDVSGAFRPGVLTALVGVSGAGKTTLMDVLSGRKTEGYIEGSINISGYPKKQATFARISGYCEQNDIHSPNVTVYESLVYSAWLRLSPDVEPEKQKMFIEEVLELIELNRIRDAMVGLPGVNGLSIEQRKRLTIAVELVANPSIIFMDEPTSGLDARAAAIVMRTVRNTVATGRTVVCTIHQPSIDIFESFDELLLMKIGGQVIYAGPLGQQSGQLIEYFEAIPGVPKIIKGCNPATWMLEISSISTESQINLDFADIYLKSPLYKRNQDLIKELDTPSSGSKDLFFPNKYSQSFSSQCMACFWKQHWSYWRNPPYNAVRFLNTIILAILFGVLFFDKGQRTDKQQDLLNVLGAIYTAIFFLGASNSMTVQPVVAIERVVFYRERAAGMYSALAYAFAQVLIEVVYIVVQSIIYSVILFSMIGFEWKAGKFFWFVFFLGMCLLYFALYGMMAVALTPGHQIAAIVMSFFFNLWNLFSGFLIFRPLTPVWWRWYFWASPIFWTIYGVVVSQYGDKEDLVEIPGQANESVKDFLKDVLGYKYNFLPYIAVAHVGFVLLFFFVFASGIKLLNFQRR